MGLLEDIEKINKLKDRFEIEAETADTLADRVAAGVGFAKLTKELAEIRETPGFMKALERKAVDEIRAKRDEQPELSKAEKLDRLVQFRRTGVIPRPS